MLASAICKRASRLWPADAAQSPTLAAVRKAWAERLDAPFPASLAGWQRVMQDDTRGDLRLIAILRDAAGHAASAGGGLQPAAAELIVALMLQAFEHHVHRLAGAHAEAQALSQGLARIDEPLAAQVVAACVSGQGLLLMPASDGGHPEAEAANVIHGLSPEALGVRDGQAAVRLEVDAALGVFRPAAGAGNLHQRRTASRRLQAAAGAVRTTDAVALDVEDFEARWHTGLLFVVNDADAAPALKDPDVCRYAGRDLRVKVYRHGGAGVAPTSATDMWAGIMANVATPLREAIAVLFPGSAAASVPAAGGVPQVFLSYAHAEDPVLLKLVCVMLAALQEQGHIRLWVDAQGIRSGEQFHPDIQQGIDGSRIALVLFSNALNGSSYVKTHELPHILRRRDAGLLTFCPLMLRKCDIGAVGAMHGVNFKFGDGPLEALDPDGKQDLLARVSQWMREHLAGRTV